MDPGGMNASFAPPHQNHICCSLFQKTNLESYNLNKKMMCSGFIVSKTHLEFHS